jgi:hypothetical protein
MKTFTGLRNLYSSTINNTQTATLTLGDQFINDSVKTICNLQGGKLRFLESTSNMYTVANQETYQIPNKYRKLIDMYIYSGSGSTNNTIYSPEMVFDPLRWKRILQYRLGSQSVPYFVYIENTSYKIQPIPSTTGNLIVLRGRLRVNDLTIADYTTGTIVSVANQGVDIVGSGTTWTQDMIGRYIQITQTSAANGGDGYWYEIGGWTDATHISLVKPYEGTDIVAGSAAYTIGQVPIVPEAYQPAINYRAVALYWQQQGELARAKTYWMMYDGGKEAGYSDNYGGLILEMLENEGETEEGSYIPPFGTSANIVSGTPYYFPFQQASGF